MPDLGTTQRRLWQLLTAPDGVRAALAAEGDPAGVRLGDLLATDARVPGPLRLEVYANAYFQRIHDVLARDFADLASATGELGFHDLVTAYLCVHPPRDPSLRHVGDRIADFLAAHDVAEPFRTRWPWAAELARFAIARGDAFDAPDASPLEARTLATIPPERWDGLTFVLVPSTRRLDTTFDVTAPAPPPAGETALLVWRADETVRFRKLAAEERELLDALAAGETFGHLCERLAQRLGAESAPARAAAWLASWVEAGLLCAS